MQQTIPIREGMVIAGCRIIERVGEGGMGVVFLARDEALDRPVAIKIMHPSGNPATARRRFQQEAAAIARLDHPGIVRIYSFGELEGLPYFIMEFIPGRPLRSFIARTRSIFFSGNDVDDLLAAGYLQHDARRPFFLTDPLRNPLDDASYPDRVRGLAVDLSEALGTAHSAGIVHRDIKPSNVLLNEAGGPKLVDFGLVKRADGGDLSLSGKASFMGTLRYAAPEQLGTGQMVSPRSDVFSLGTMLYELVTLSHPFDPDETDDSRLLVGRIVRGDCRDPRELNPHLSGDFADALRKCLAPDPAHRFAEAGAVAAHLRQIAAGSDSWTAGLGRFFRRVFTSWSTLGSSSHEDNAPRTTRFERDTGQPSANPPVAGVPSTGGHGADSGSPGPGTSPPGSDPPANATAGLRPANTTVDGQLASLREAARRHLFHEFSIGGALETIEQLLALEPTDTVGLFYLTVALHGIGDHATLRARMQPFATPPAHWSEADRRKIGIIRRLFVEHNFKQAEREATAYLQLFPADRDMLYCIAISLAGQGQLAKVIAIGAEIAAAFPDDNLVPFLAADAYEDAGDFVRAAAILDAAVMRFAQLSTLRTKAVGVLLFTGQLDRAQEHLAVMNRAPHDRDLALMLRARLNVFRHRPQAAIDDLRTLISMSENQGLRVFGGYFLYRLLRAEGSMAAARTALDQANAAQAPALLPTVEAAQDTINRHDLSGFASAGRPEPWLDLACAESRSIAVGALDAEAYTHGNFGRVRCFAIGVDGSVAQTLIFAQFSIDNRDHPVAWFRLPKAPQTPLIDGRGRILQTEIRPLPEPYPGVMAIAHLAEPLRTATAEFVRVDFAPDPPAGAGGRRWRFSAPPFLATAARRHALLIYVPRTFVDVGRNDEPQARIDLADGTVYVYRRFLFAGQSMTAELDLESRSYP